MAHDNSLRIGQGSVFRICAESLETLCEIGFDGYAMGGLAVGEKAMSCTILLIFDGLYAKGATTLSDGALEHRRISWSIERGGYV